MQPSLCWQLLPLTAMNLLGIWVLENEPLSTLNVNLKSLPTLFLHVASSILVCCVRDDAD